ncbi:AMP-binding protein [Conexibacter sp. JD483]|uniref:class I adenylate-forming enzyme family protein n=1 Tax=unclassified Conexibacter TaxID=2627773 RepID=UPI002725C63B|nr:MULTISPECIES: AMP-binding protein [unclassified Conexibacter]MDO8187738.1 AMP-binding protein [Conexibacter sp. CPCC 205706]MDO8200241.1 AMP-binding protein [Conexibacter sp. CPCC 205762]MDR9369417.1 AMP-binding protein [Conexibacter sp. JD483]
MGLYGLADSLYRNRLARQADVDRTALVFEDRRISYGELEARVRRLATGLANAGFKPEDRCAILLYNRPEYVELYYAIAHLGGVAVPLNYYLKGPEIAYALEDSGTTWLVHEPAFDAVVDSIADELSPDMRRISLTDAATDALRYEEVVADGAAGDIPVAPTAPEDLFLLQYTSGTTGLPKAAMHSHGNILFNALTQVAEFAMTEDDVHLVLPALCWGAGFHDYTVATWWRGGTVVLRPSGGFSGEEFCGKVEQHGISIVLLVPSVLRLVLEGDSIERHDMSSLRLILCGGEHVPIEAIEDLQRRLPNAQFLQGYGLSEFPTIMTYLDGEHAITKRGSAGRASMSATVRVVDEHGADTPPGEPGQIICRSPAVTHGYLGREDATGTTLVDGWLHTGDRGWVDEDGFLYIAGRVKDMIISGGLNVYPAEIERVLGAHPAVKEAAVVGVPHERYSEVGRAIVVVDDLDAVDQDELEALCRERLANFKVPREWEIRVEPLPRTTSGKVQKFLLVPAHDRR